jgi:hypothetical protein
MKLAMIFIGRKKETPIFLHDNYGKPPPMLMLGSGTQIAFLVVVAATLLWLWFAWLAPLFQKMPPPAVRVPRVQQVNMIDPDAPLKLGDVVLVASKQSVSAGRITALPRQSVVVRQPGGGEHFMVLGANRYYVVADQGGIVMSRADIRGLVQSQL